jgi:hypothetical protein
MYLIWYQRTYMRIQTYSDIVSNTPLTKMNVMHHDKKETYTHYHFTKLTTLTLTLNPNPTSTIRLFTIITTSRSSQISHQHYPTSTIRKKRLKIAFGSFISQSDRSFTSCLKPQSSFSPAPVASCQKDSEAY